MTNTWEKLWKQCESATVEFNAYIDSGIPSFSQKKILKFIKEYDKLKELIEKFDKFMQNPVEPIEVKIPYDEPDFVQTWEYWKEYRVETFGKAYKSREEQKVLEYLEEISEGRPDLAIKYLNFAMAGSYPRFFKVSEKAYNNPQNTGNNEREASSFDE